MLCVNHLCEPPENLKTISAIPLDDWNEKLKPFIKDYKLEVISYNYHISILTSAVSDRLYSTLNDSNVFILSFVH